MEYSVSCDVCELPRGKGFIVMPGPVVPGTLALLDVEGLLIPGRWDGVNQLELPGLILELGESLSYHVVGAIVPVDPETAYNCLN
jgi:hypothetical protein